LRTECAEQAWRESRASATEAREEVRMGMLVHSFGDLRIEFANRLLGLLDLVGQESDHHRCWRNQRFIPCEQLSRTNAVDDLILLLAVANGVFTQNPAN
jgi:hypothetical protein